MHIHHLLRTIKTSQPTLCLVNRGHNFMIYSVLVRRETLFPRPLACGALQNSSLSCLLFNIYTKMLVRSSIRPWFGIISMLMIPIISVVVKDMPSLPSQMRLSRFSINPSILPGLTGSAQKGLGPALSGMPAVPFPSQGGFQIVTHTLVPL